MVAVAVVIGVEAWTRIAGERELRQAVADLETRSERAGAAATLAGDTATQALIRANEAATTASQASALAASAKEAADQAAVLAAKLAAVASPAPVPLPTSAAGKASPEQGRGLAVLICSACHVVSPDQPFAPTLKPPAPDFAAIAERSTTEEKSLHEFLRVPHGKMPDVLLADYQIDALIAYILSLKVHR
jgi:mono/diheme cytochrome c family protein